MENSQRTTPSELARIRRSAFLSFCILLFVSLHLLLLASCASPGEPVERKPQVPRAITDLAAVQTGNDVALSFTLPKETEDRHPLKQIPAIEIFRSIRPASQPVSSPASATLAAPALLLTIPSALVDHYISKDRVRYVDSLKAEDFLPDGDNVAVYSVRARESAKKESADSNLVELRIYPAADPLDGVKAEVTHSAIALTWTPPQKNLVGAAPVIAGYRVYRAEAEPGSPESVVSGIPKLKSPLARIGDPDSPSFRDSLFEFGKTYVYSVRSLAQFPGATFESGDSNLVVVTPRDTFSPAVPLGLVIVFVPAAGNTPSHFELSWAINPETDIAGYNVYRTEEGAPSAPSRVNSGLLLTPAFRDMNVVPGRMYLYSITAVGRSGNESPASATVSASVPDEGQPSP